MSCNGEQRCRLQTSASVNFNFRSHVQKTPPPYRLADIYFPSLGKMTLL